MTYKDFLESIEHNLKISTGFYTEICLDDEIELRTGTTYPAAFIIPVPFEVYSPNSVQYACKIYLVGNVTRDPKLHRISTYSDMVNSAMSFIQQLPDDHINKYPITINPIIKWDSNVDGVYFELIVNSRFDCV